MTQVDPSIVSVGGAIAAIMAAITTGVLAKITYDYMRETRLIRLSAQRPSFSFEPTTYALGGSFYQINLVNYGQVANNIHVECTWEETKDTETTRKMKKFFVMSLSNQGRATLHDISIAEIVNKVRS